MAIWCEPDLGLMWPWSTQGVLTLLCHFRYLRLLHVYWYGTRGLMMIPTAFEVIADVSQGKILVSWLLCYSPSRAGHYVFALKSIGKKFNLTDSFSLDKPSEIK